MKLIEFIGLYHLSHPEMGTVEKLNSWAISGIKETYSELEKMGLTSDMTEDDAKKVFIGYNTGFRAGAGMLSDIHKISK